MSRRLRGFGSSCETHPTPDADDAAAESEDAEAVDAETYDGHIIDAEVANANAIDARLGLPAFEVWFRNPKNTGSLQ
jgi:hypothetical protein